MLLSDYLAEKGNAFFRYRGYLYLLVLPLLYLERSHFHYPFHSHTADTICEGLCLSVSMLGVMIRALTVGFVTLGTSGRNKKAQYAESLNTTGLYSLCRNPLYLGNYMVFLGITLLGQSWELLVINTLVFAAMHVPIIMTEERYLLGKFGDQYRHYVSVTPCFIPKLSLWKAPALRWSWWMVIRREHDTVFTLVIANLLMEYIRDSVVSGRLRMDFGWTLVGLVGLVLWLTIKIAKRPLRRLSERTAA